MDVLRAGFLKAYMALILIGGLVAWWVVLAHKSRLVAQEESNRQTHLLLREIDLHRQTDEALQRAKQVAEEARGSRPGQPGQKSLHQRHQPRVAYTAQQHPSGLRPAHG